MIFSQTSGQQSPPDIRYWLNLESHIAVNWSVPSLGSVGRGEDSARAFALLLEGFNDVCRCLAHSTACQHTSVMIHNGFRLSVVNMRPNQWEVATLQKLQILVNGSMFLIILKAHISGMSLQLLPSPEQENWCQNLSSKVCHRMLYKSSRSELTVLKTLNLIHFWLLLQLVNLR